VSHYKVVVAYRMADADDKQLEIVPNGWTLVAVTEPATVSEDSTVAVVPTITPVTSSVVQVGPATPASGLEAPPATDDDEIRLFADQLAALPAFVSQDEIIEASSLIIALLAERDQARQALRDQPEKIVQAIADATPDSDRYFDSHDMWVATCDGYDHAADIAREFASGERID